MTHGTTDETPPAPPILVIDDDRDTAESMARYLRIFGHEVQVAHNGSRALEIAQRLRPHHVLLDLGLPGLDGYQVASRLRRELDGPIDIIAITGHGQEEDRRRSREAGIDHHLIKPIDLTFLLSLLPPSPSPSSSASG